MACSCSVIRDLDRPLVVDSNRPGPSPLDDRYTREPLFTYSQEMNTWRFSAPLVWQS